MRRGENQSTRRKTSQSKGELNPHIMLTLGFEPGPYWSETSALTPALLCSRTCMNMRKTRKKTFIKKFEQQQCAHLCLISQIIIFFGVGYSPQLMFSVKDVIHPSRVAAILFPLHPARMLHILFFTLGGSLSAWWFLGIRNEEDGYFTKVSEKYVD